MELLTDGDPVCLEGFRHGTTAGESGVSVVLNGMSPGDTGCPIAGEYKIYKSTDNGKKLRKCF